MCCFYLLVFESVSGRILFAGPLSVSIKSKRHEIKSDPTPFGYEGTKIVFLSMMNCVICDFSCVFFSFWLMSVTFFLPPLCDGLC